MENKTCSKPPTSYICLEIALWMILGPCLNLQGESWGETCCHATNPGARMFGVEAIPNLKQSQLPSGKRLHNYGKIHHFWWVNYFDWAIFYVAFCRFTRPGHSMGPRNEPKTQWISPQSWCQGVEKEPRAAAFGVWTSRPLCSLYVACMLHWKTSTHVDVPGFFPFLFPFIQIWSDKDHESITLWWTNSSQLKMAKEIVDFPMKNGGSFHDFPLLC